MKEYELRLVIAALIRHVQELTIELAAVLHDISAYLPEDTKSDIRQMKPDEINIHLITDPDYACYVVQDCEGMDELTEQCYLDEVEDYLNEEGDDLFYPSYYSRKELLK